jgi:putative inorganic carbon (HCO3(-)) transporter
VKSLDTFFERTCGGLPGHPVARWAAVFFSLFVLALQISIAASQALLAVAAILYAIHLLKDRPEVHFLPVKLPLACFCVFSIASIFWAANPTVGWFAVRKLVLFLIWILAVNLIVSREHLRRLVLAFCMVSALAGVVAIMQFVVQYRDVRAHHPDQIYRILTSLRIDGFMGHWMNFGGQQMLAYGLLMGFLLLSAVAPRAGFLNGRREEKSDTPSASVVPTRISKLWWAVLAIVAVSIILNFTRGVWLGCFVATVYMVARWKPIAFLALPVLLAVGYVGAPSLVRERLSHAIHPTEEPALNIRLEMWRVAVRMIRAHPLVGVGPNNIEQVYNLYLPPGTTPVEGYHSHFHNDFFQFGAERGLPCLLSWVWLMAALGWHAWKARRRLLMQRWIADAALAGWLAFLAEGCFEFNFGTSPVLMVFLFVISTPFVAAGVRDFQEDRDRQGEISAPRRDPFQAVPSSI